MSRTKKVLEALLFAAPEPVSADKLSAILSTEQAVSVREVRLHLAELAAQYDEEQRSIALEKVSGGRWAFRTRKEFAPFIQQLHKEKSPAKLSRAASEVLAIVAYRQPLSRADIDKLRGVDSSAPLASLLERKLVQTTNRSRPALYATTRQFLLDFGIDDLADLPFHEKLSPALK